MFTFIIIGQIIYFLTYWRIVYVPLFLKVTSAIFPFEKCTVPSPVGLSFIQEHYLLNFICFICIIIEKYSFSTLFTIMKFSNVCIPIRIIHHSLSFLFIIFEKAFIPIIFLIYKFSFSVFLKIITNYITLFVRYT